MTTLKKYQDTVKFLQGFISRLRSARAAVDLTQGQVASVLGCTQDTVANYERGRTEPNLENTTRLARLYRVSVDWLCSGPPARIHGDLCDHGVPIRDRCMFCEMGVKAS